MAFDDYYEWKPYESAAARAARTARVLLALKKSGAAVSPVAIDGRTIARTFWGKAWCENLERYSDFANRLPRGRTYLRSGAVLDLQVAAGAVTALVSGSDLYRVRVDVAEVPRARWSAICHDCSGAIDSVIELLQGHLSERVMTRLCDAKTGLFPSPREIVFSCSCPDRASMCKHVAAVLYGIGARLDRQPEMLFVLRRVDQAGLVAKVGSGLARAKRPAEGRILEADLSEVFGVEISDAMPTAAPKPLRGSRGSRAVTTAAPAAAPDRFPALPDGSPKQPSTGRAARITSVRRSKAASPRRELSAAEGASIAQRMKEYWADRRKRARDE